jgi:monothiol glutaredoxin
MNRLATSRLFLQNNKKLFQAFVARYSVDTGSKDYIDGLVKDKKVVVFMKGTADQPRCGFSNAVVQILNFHGVQNFADYNVLEDESLRQGAQYTP